MTRLIATLAVALIGSTSPTAAAPPVRATEVAVSEGSTCIRRVDGTVACWGRLSDLASKPVEVRSLLGIVDLDLGRRHACAVRDDGTVWCWGENADGQLGDGTREPRAEPVQALGLTDAVEVVADRVHSCARRRNGTIACWGRSAFIGDGAEEDRLVPTATRRLRDVVSLVAGDDLTCAIRDDRTLWCWGFNTTGLLNPKLGPVLTPRAAVGIDGVTELALGWRHGCMRLANRDASKGVPERRLDGVVLCFGNNSRGQLGDQSVPDGAFCHAGSHEVRCTWRPPRPATVDERRDIPFDRHFRPPPDPPQEERRYPVRSGSVVAAAMHVEHLVASDGRSCGIEERSGVVCWGRGYESPEWSFHRPRVIAGTNGAVQVAVEQHHGCAVMADGDVRCWGAGHTGALGDGTTESRAAAAPVSW